MEIYPKVKQVEALEGKRILVTFNNNIRKIYDCSSLLEEEIFSSLADDSLFKSVKADQGGYGISWGEEIDLSESELWINGLSVAQEVPK